MTKLPPLDVEGSRKPAWLRYSAAIAFVIIMWSARTAAAPILGAQSPYLPFFLGVILSAWYGGLGPAFVTTLLSIPAAYISFIHPAPINGPEMIRMAMFLGQGFLVAWLFEVVSSSRRRLADVLESISDGFTVLDKDWRFAYVNQRAAAMARSTPQQMLGRRVWELFPETQGSDFENHLRQVAATGRPANFEYRYPVWDTWYLFGAYPSSEGVVLFSQDITHVKEARSVIDEAREKIEQINVELEQRVDERTAQLNATIRELEAFSYSISHDLRAPLRAIDGFSKMLHDDYFSKLDDEGKRLIEIIRHNTTNMGRLIDGLLAFSRLGRQQMGHAHLSMSELTRDAIEEVRGSSNGRNVEFRVNNLPDADGDRVLMRQVLINLLSNSVKFTAGKDPAVIEVGSKAADDHNTFFVRDNGVGFDSRYADKMFGVFQRLHAATEFEGTGLGLAIVQRIVHRHGGRVWAEGKPGVGATVYFTLPKPESEMGKKAGTLSA